MELTEVERARLRRRARHVVWLAKAWRGFSVDADELIEHALAGSRAQSEGDVEDWASGELARRYLVALVCHLGLTAAQAERQVEHVLGIVGRPRNAFEVELVEEALRDHYAQGWPLLTGASTE